MGQQQWTVEAEYFGSWIAEASGFVSIQQARAYVRNARFWDGTARRIRRTV